jgi:hypothetical protein
MGEKGRFMRVFVFLLQGFSMPTRSPCNMALSSSRSARLSALMASASNSSRFKTFVSPLPVRGNALEHLLLDGYAAHALPPDLDTRSQATRGLHHTCAWTCSSVLV